MSRRRRDTQCCTFCGRDTTARCGICNRCLGNYQPPPATTIAVRCAACGRRITVRPARSGQDRDRRDHLCVRCSGNGVAEELERAHE